MSGENGKIILGILVGGGIGFFKALGSAHIVGDTVGMIFFAIHLGLYILGGAGIGLGIAITEIFLEDMVRSYGVIP